jgi:hypothetical protein
VADHPEPVQAMVDLGEVAKGDGLEHVERRPNAHIGHVSIESLELSQGPPVHGLALGSPCLARIGEPIVEPLVADQGSEERIGLDQSLPVVVDQCTRAIDLITHVASTSFPDSRTRQTTS